MKKLQENGLFLVWEQGFCKKKKKANQSYMKELTKKMQLKLRKATNKCSFSLEIPNVSCEEYFQF